MGLALVTGITALGVMALGMFAFGDPGVIISDSIRSIFSAVRLAASFNCSALRRLLEAGRVLGVDLLGCADLGLRSRSVLPEDTL